MSITSFVRSFASAFTIKAKKASKRRASFRLNLEVLEDRALLSGYSIVDLGLMGGASSDAFGINEAGQIVGSVFDASGGARAFLWQHGSKIDLGVLSTASFSRARDINESGQIVGVAGVSTGYQHAFLLTPEDTNGDGAPDRWLRLSPSGTNELMTDLGGLSTSYQGSSWGNALNDNGAVTGWATYLPQDGSTAKQHAFRWDGAMTDLGGQDSSYGLGINNLGQVAGRVTRENPQRAEVFESQAAVWNEAGTALVLTALPGDSASDAANVNEAGQIIGTSGVIAKTTGSPITIRSYYSAEEGVLWENGTATSLGSLLPSAINNVGQIVGGSRMWEHGLVRDLLAEIDSSLGWTSLSANDINDRGQIVGFGFRNGERHAFLLNPDSLATLAISDVAVTEGNAGTVNAVFTVTRSGSSAETITLGYSTANMTALAGSDYQAQTGVLTFAPGETSKTIAVPVNADTFNETNETFVVNLHGAANALLADAQGLATITDDDPVPALSINDVTIIEGASGIRYAVFTVTLSAAGSSAITVNYATANGTAKTSDNDYVAKSGKLTFAAGETSKTIMIEIKGNRKREANETFFVNLTSATNATIFDGQGIGTILNDD